nr:hypothetical protein Iba_chr02cCG10060 [Ipomoea batatas]
MAVAGFAPDISLSSKRQELQGYPPDQMSTILVSIGQSEKPQGFQPVKPRIIKRRLTGSVIHANNRTIKYKAIEKKNVPLLTSLKQNLSSPRHIDRIIFSIFSLLPSARRKVDGYPKSNGLLSHLQTLDPANVYRIGDCDSRLLSNSLSVERRICALMGREYSNMNRSSVIVLQLADPCFVTIVLVGGILVERGFLAQRNRTSPVEYCSKLNA